jgi:hypothetical protein
VLLRCSCCMRRRDRSGLDSFCHWSGVSAALHLVVVFLPVGLTHAYTTALPPSKRPCFPPCHCNDLLRGLVPTCVFLRVCAYRSAPM